MRRFIFIVLLASAPLRAADVADDPPEPSDIDVAVTLGPSEQSGKATAIIKIHAARELVWSLITSCAENLKILPGLKDCQVVNAAPDQSWQIIRHVMIYSWYVPTLTYEIRATYQRPRHVDIERVSGDLRHLSGSWDLSTEGDSTVARYQVEMTPGFWVPHWMVRAALRRDLPKMLRALRARAEAKQAS